MSAGFAVIVAFVIKPESRAAFMALLRENAQLSLARERDCRRFDIIEPAQRPDEVWLYEIYANPGAFDDHLKAPHFLRFDAATREMITSKTVVAGGLEEYDRP